MTRGCPAILTPLTWSFYFPAAEQASRGAWCNLGAMPERQRPVPEDVDARFFNAVMGRAAANLDLFGGMADRMPGGSAAAMEEQLFGSTEAVAGRERDRSRYPAVALKAPLSLSERALAPMDESRIQRFPGGGNRSPWRSRCRIPWPRCRHLEEARRASRGS